MTLLENVGSYHSWKLDFKEMDALKRLLQWPIEFKLPVWDLLRAFLKHYQSEALFSGLDLGGDTLGPLCSASADPNTPEPLSGVILKLFANMFIQNTNSNAMLTYGESILGALQNIHNRGFSNKSVLSGFSAVLLNFSIAVTTKKLSAQQTPIITRIL